MYKHIYTIFFPFKAKRENRNK